jgi:hypothetical protein
MRAKLGTWRVLSAVGVLVISACSDDEGDPRPQMDATVPDATIDAATDGKVDTVVDGGNACDLDQDYEFYFDGGLAPFRYRFELSSTGLLSKKYIAEGVPDAGGKSCSAQLACSAAANVDLAEVGLAVASASVISAFGDGTQVLGRDTRPVDGQVLIVEREDGKKIVIGDDCGSATPCVEVPVAIAMLRTTLRQLIVEQQVVTLDGGITGEFCP